VAPILKTIRVDRSVADAFRLFTKEIHSWWPLSQYSINQEGAKHCVFEGRKGGQIYEEDEEGQKYIWGTVAEWDPPHRVVFSWHPGRSVETAQEVELRFRGVGSGTELDLEHRGWDLLGDDAERSRGSYDTGWDDVLKQYASG
jgi:uncharacterized protein YndB with AHSA1/START domain